MATITKPIINRVTLTGADESIRPEVLLALSAEFPFVEWGILFSLTNQGKPRYPRRTWLDWLNVLVREFPAERQPNFSAHLCGRWMLDALDGTVSWWEEHSGMAGLFDRVQLNFHAERMRPGLTDLITTLQHRAEQNCGRRQQLIFQVDGVNDFWVKPLVTVGLGVPLFDKSGGAGVLPGEWPRSWDRTYCGYAGGLGPDNVVKEVLAIELASSGPAWIDMESRIRSNDGDDFDITKARQVLEALVPYVQAGPGL